MIKRTGPRGITLIESILGMTILIIVIGAAMLAIKMISKGSASQVMNSRAETGLKDAAEVIRNMSGDPGLFESEDFTGTYYFPSVSKDSQPADWMSLPIRVQATVNQLDIFNHTREMIVTADWKEGFHAERKTMRVILTKGRPSSTGGDVIGRVIDGKRLAEGATEGVRNIIVESIREGDDGRIWTRTDAAGNFVLKGVKATNNTKVTFRGDGKPVPFYYFRDIDGPSGEDMWHYTADTNNKILTQNSATFNSYFVNVQQGSVNKLDGDPVATGDNDPVVMWPFGSLHGRITDKENGSGYTAGVNNVIVEAVIMRTEIPYFRVGSRLLLTSNENGEDGSFTFTNLVPGNYKIFVHGSGEFNDQDRNKDPFLYTQTPNLRDIAYQEPYVLSPPLMYAGAAEPDDIQTTSDPDMNLKDTPNYIRVLPGQMYDDGGGTHNHGGTMVTHAAGHHVLNTRLAITRKGHVQGAVRKMRSSGANYVDDGAAPGVVIVARSNPTEVFPAVFPSPSPSIEPGYPAVPHPFNLANTQIWQEGGPGTYADKSVGAYARHNRKFYRKAISASGSGHISFNNLTVPIINKGDVSSLFTQTNRFLFFPDKVSAPYAPALIIPGQSGRPPHYVLNTGEDGGTSSRYEFDYMVVPAQQVFEDAPENYPLGSQTGYDNFDGGPIEEDLIQPFLLTNQVNNRNFYILNRDELANLHGNIKGGASDWTTGNGYADAVEGRVYSFGMITEGDVDSAAGWFDVWYSRETDISGNDHTYNFRKNGTGIFRLLPTIMSYMNPSTFGNGNGYGNGRFVHFLASKATAIPNFVYKGKLLATKKIWDTTELKWKIIPITPNVAPLRMQATGAQGSSGALIWDNATFTLVGSPDSNGRISFETSAQVARKTLNFSGRTGPIALAPKADPDTPITISSDWEEWLPAWLRVKSNSTYQDMSFWNNREPQFLGLRTLPVPTAAPTEYVSPSGSIKLVQIQSISEIYGYAYAPITFQPVENARVHLWRTYVDRMLYFGYKDTDATGFFEFTDPEAFKFLGIDGNNFRLRFDPPPGKNWVSKSSTNNMYTEGHDSYKWGVTFNFEEIQGGDTESPGQQQESY